MDKEDKEIKAIIFDLGGVIFKEFSPPNTTLKYKLSNSEYYKDLVFKFSIGYYGDEVETFIKDLKARSQEILKATSDLSQEIVGIPENLEEFKSEWNKSILEIDVKFIDQFINLKQSQVKYQLFVLSDNNLIHKEYMLKLYEKHIKVGEGFIKLFDGTYFSHETGKRKGLDDQDQAKQAWIQILEENVLDPEECLFIDDKENNIEIAKKLKFKVLHYNKECTFDSIIQILNNKINKETYLLKASIYT